MFLRRTIVALCTLLLEVASFAQRPARHPPAAAPAQAATTPDPYSKEPAVTLSLDTIYRYRADGTGSKTDTATLRVQTADGVQALNILRVPFLPGLQQIEFTGVRVHKPNGQIVETPPADAGEQPAPLTAAIPELSTLRYAVLGIRGLAVGDRLELGIRTTFLASQAPGQFWGADAFAQGRVILKRTLELHVPAGKTVLVASPHLQPEITATPEEKTYRWTGAQLRPTSTRPASPSPTAPTIAWTTFSSWAEAGAWYQSILITAGAPTPDVKRRADQIVYGLRTPEARVQALYRYLATSVRAVSVPLQNRPFRPHTASEILNTQLGDSTDRAVLFTAMCRAEGLAAALALVAPGQVLQEDVPSPEQFTEVITLVQTGTSKPIWLNTASETAPFAALFSELRDRPALVLPGEGAASLQRTAATLPFAAADTFTSRAELSAEGTLTAHIDLSLRGDAELRLRDAFHQTDESRWDRVAQLYLRSLNVIGTPSNTTVATLANPDVPLQVSFDLAQPLYGDWAAHRIVPLEPGLDLPYTDRVQPAEAPLDLGFQRTASAHTSLLLPAGWTAAPPPRLHTVTAFATLDKTCRLEPGFQQHAILLCDRELHILQSQLPTDKWADYLAFLDQAAASEPWIQLTPPGATNQKQPAQAVNSIDAARKIAEARDALGRKDLSTATLRLEEAKTLNPQQPMLWATAGFLAQAKGDPKTAEADYRHELDTSPNQAGVSLQLAALLQSEGRGADALALLQKANTLDPGNAAVAQQLARALDTTNPTAAETVLQNALQRQPDSLSLKLALGTTLLQHGHNTQGAALLKEVADTSQDAAELNDAAFALGDAGLELRAAELAALHALRLINAQSVSPPAEGPNAAGLRQTLQLTACWDTLGWIIFRQGSLSEAEIWLEAAWNDSFGAAAGQHLGQLLARQGHRDEAGRIAHLAAEAEQPELSSVQGNLREALSERPTSPQQKASVLAARSIPVPRPPRTPAGTARFELTRGEAPESTTARWISGDAALTSVAESLRHVDLHTVVPAQTSARIVRTGLLRCPASGPCTFLLLPARAALVQ